jgi:hypothetical protein
MAVSPALKALGAATRWIRLTWLIQRTARSVTPRRDGAIKRTEGVIERIKARQAKGSPKRRKGVAGESLASWGESRNGEVALMSYGPPPNRSNASQSSNILVRQAPPLPRLKLPPLVTA